MAWHLVPGPVRRLATVHGRAALYAGAVAVLPIILIACVMFRGGEQQVSFNRDIRPIFNRSCIGCHGGVRQSGQFSVQFPEEALGKAASGKFAIVPGSPDRSELIRRISLPHGDAQYMPKRGNPLSPAEVELLRRWVAQGAKWETHWAYVTPKLPAVPSVSKASWPVNPIDNFVLAKLEMGGQAPSPRADCWRLMRRVSFDLTGLPPRYDEALDFCHDPSQAAYTRVVDRLLASSAFGEHWASMWLDLAHYADTIGGEVDQDREIWQYRDWVVRALNEDLPFDQFTIDQLAGDMLPSPGTDQLMATAFNRLSVVGASFEEEDRQDSIFDRVETTWNVWQGQTIGCARCHSHTYDPFRQSEYYKLTAFFNNSLDDATNGNRNALGGPTTAPPPFARYGVKASEVVEWPLLFTFSDKDKAVGDALVARRVTLLEIMRRNRLRPDVVADRRAWEKWYIAYKESHPKYTANDLVLKSIRIGYTLNDIDRIVTTPEAKRSPNDVSRLDDFYVRSVAPQFAAERAEVEDLENRIFALRPIKTPIMQERPEYAVRPSYVLARGVLATPDLRQPVQPDVPSIMPPLPKYGRRTRLDLARWLVDDRNPLTARVTVNRIWAQLFDHGLVRTLDNFGTTGEAPTNQALLDWLAVSFRTEMHWRLKTLVRTMVLSATYQQGSSAAPAAFAADPFNAYLGRGPRMRLTAEEIFDQSLAVSGLLNRKAFGPPVTFPTAGYQKQIGFGGGSDYVVSDEADRHRRAIWGRVRRHFNYPNFEVFDHPNRDVTTAERSRTNSPLQALMVLDDPIYNEATDRIAAQMAASGLAPREQIVFAYRTILARDPSPRELAVLTETYTSAARDGRARLSKASLHRSSSALLPARLVASVILNSDAALTKE